MPETAEELEERQAREVEELEEKKTELIEAAKAATKGKKAKLDDAEREVSRLEYEMSCRHQEEQDELAEEGDAGATSTDNVPAKEEAKEDKKASAKKASKENNDDGMTEAERIRLKKEKAKQKRDKKEKGDNTDDVDKKVPDKKKGVPAPLMSPSGRMMSSPSMGATRSPSMRWKDDPVSVEDIVPAVVAAKPDFEIIEGVQPFSDISQADPRLKQILEEVKALSMDAFEEDALGMVTRKAKWKMTLLVRTEAYYDKKEASATKTPFQSLDKFSLDEAAEAEPVDEEEEPPLIGFIVYRLRPEYEAFSIAKVAVVPEHRGKGHGGRLMDWAKAQAKKGKDIKYISLSSLPDAVRFYKKIGFQPVEVKTLREGECADHEEFVEGQVYMEYQVRKRGKKK